MKKTLLVLLMLVAVLGSLFAAKTTITVWYSISGEKATVFNNLVEQFQKDYPDITVKAVYQGSYSDTSTKVSAAKIAGNLPDAVITAASQLYTIEDGDYSMEQSVQDADFNVSDINSGAMDYAKFLGHTGAVPFAISTPVVYYNKDLVAKAGYDFEANPPETWEEFITAIKDIQLKISEMDAAASASSSKSTKKSKSKKSSSTVKLTVSGFDVKDTKWLFKSMLYQNGCSIVELDSNGDIVATFANDEAVEVGEFWQRMVEEQVMDKAMHDNAQKKFESGNLISFCGSSALSVELVGNTSFEIGAIEMPYFKKKAVAIGGSTATIFTKDSTKYDAAWTFLKYLLNTENQTEFAIQTGYLPIRKSALELDSLQEELASNEAYAVAVKQLDYAFAYTHFGAMGSMDLIIPTALEDIEFGADVRETLEDAVVELFGDL